MKLFSVSSWPYACGMKFREIAARMTGLSIPIGGVSWQPPSDVTKARSIINFLEDRRVLYSPSGLPNFWVMGQQRFEPIFNQTLGALRGEFGYLVGALAAKYGLDVDDELAAILPATGE